MRTAAVFIVLFVPAFFRAQALAEATCAELFPKRNPILGSFNRQDEGWDWSRVLPLPHSFRLLPTKPEVGTFEIRKTDAQISNGWRSELREHFVARRNSTTCTSFSTRLEFDPQEVHLPSLVLAQWHEVVPKGTKARRPPLTLRLIDNQVKLVLFNGRVLKDNELQKQGQFLGSFNVEKNVWYNWMLVARWSPDDQGFVDFYLDGKKLVSYQGPIGYEDDPEGPYFKFGVYTVHPFDKPLTVSHRSYQRTIVKRGPWDLF